MSLIIKGMDMPKKGVYHAVITFDGDSLGVRIPPSKEPFFSGRIVHMPTPHGRLIDADELYEQFINEFCNRNCDESVRGEICDRCGVLRAINMIKSAPTIIEAEVSE